MKKHFYYWAGAALFLCVAPMFTSCTETKYEAIECPPCNGGGNGEDEDSEGPAAFDGTYSSESDADGTLKMTYNGEELPGKSVTFMTNSDGETANIELAGSEVDLTSLIGGLMEFKYTSYSPVPGQKTILLSDVELTPNEDESAYSFEATVNEATYGLVCKGTVTDGEMTVDIEHTLSNEELVGFWSTLDAKTSSGSEPANLRPMAFNWESNVDMNLGKILILNIKGNPNKILNTLFGTLGSFALNSILGIKQNGVEGVVAAALDGVGAEKNGGMYASYMYNIDLNNLDFNNPLYSTNMSRNIMRYYFGEGNQLFIEANGDYLVSMAGALMNSRAGDPEATKEIARELIAKLVPILEKGFPCTYELNGEELVVTLDKVFVRDVFEILARLANDPFAMDYVKSFVDGLGLGDEKDLIMNLLTQLPYATKYAEGDAAAAATAAAAGEDPVAAGNLSGECGGINVSLYFKKGTPNVIE